MLAARKSDLTPAQRAHTRRILWLLLAYAIILPALYAPIIAMLLALVFLARMLRLRRTLRLARSHQGPLRLAELAVAAGYFDQQHLAHEVRAIMGTTPTGFLRSR